MPIYKSILYFYVALACIGCENRNERELDQLENKKVPSNTNSSKATQQNDSLELELKIDKAAMNRVGASTYIISQHIQRAMQSSDSISVDSLINTRVEFRDHSGKLLSIPLKSLLEPLD